MKIKILLFLVFFSYSCKKNTSIKLFNEKDMDGWEHEGDGNFVVENNMLKTQGGMGLLWYTKNKFENVKIKVIFKGSENNNSGVFIRIPEKPTEAWMPVNKGYEVQIDSREDEYHSTGVLYSITKAKAKPDKPNEWNEMIITLDGDRTIVHVNDVLVTDFREGDVVPEKVKEYEPDRNTRPKSGYIGIQNHSDKDTIYFKEISTMPL